MGIFNKIRTDGVTYDGQGEERKGLIEVIQYNGEADELVWKFPYNNITNNAPLVVNESQEVIFAQGGKYSEVFGPGTHTLSTNNPVILRKLRNLAFGGNTPFTAEVWYVNKIIRRDLTFGTIEPIPAEDPDYDVPIPVRSFGEFGVQIVDSSAFVQQLVGTAHEFTTDMLIEQFEAFIIQELTAAISKTVMIDKISVTKINAYIKEIANAVRDAITEEFAQFGVRITNFNIKSLNYDKDDPTVKEAMAGRANRARLKQLSDQVDMYRIERQLDVMETAAGNEGGAGQMMGAGMGLGMGFGVGGAFGQQMGNIAGVMQQQPIQQQQAVAPTPPPPPTATVWFVLINNQQYQYDINALGQYIQSGQVTRDTLVWKAGMAQWVKAGESPELQGFFGAPPPPPPPPIV